MSTSIYLPFFFFFLSRVDREDICTERECVCVCVCVCHTRPEAHSKSAQEERNDRKRKAATWGVVCFTCSSGSFISAAFAYCGTAAEAHSPSKIYSNGKEKEEKEEEEEKRRSKRALSLSIARALSLREDSPLRAARRR